MWTNGIIIVSGDCPNESGWRALSAAEIAAYQATQVSNQAKADNASLLAKTDITLARIQEAIILGLVLPTDATVVAWVNYRKALRAGQPATKPATYPTGT